VTLAAADIKFKLSVTTGPGNSTAQANANASLGEFMSSTEITDATIRNLFDDVSGAENTASDVEYRCMFIHNAHASRPWQSVRVWISSEVAGGASVAIALDGVGVTAATSATAQAEEIPNESTAPSGESFSSPTTKALGLTVGDVAAGQCFAVWVRRTAANTATVNSDGATIRAEGLAAAL
jgi:hypothetical protein